MSSSSLALNLIDRAIQPPATLKHLEHTPFQPRCLTQQQQHPLGWTPRHPHSPTRADTTTRLRAATSVSPQPACFPVPAPSPCLPMLTPPPPPPQMHWLMLRAVCSGASRRAPASSCTRECVPGISLRAAPQRSPARTSASPTPGSSSSPSSSSPVAASTATSSSGGRRRASPASLPKSMPTWRRCGLCPLRYASGGMSSPGSSGRSAHLLGTPRRPSKDPARDSGRE